jgi:hypothetical protein
LESYCVEVLPAVVVDASVGQHTYAYGTVRKKIKKDKRQKKHSETTYLVVSGAQASSTGAAGIAPIVIASCPWCAGGKEREGGKEGRGGKVEGEGRTHRHS